MVLVGRNLGRNGPGQLLPIRRRIAATILALVLLVPATIVVADSPTLSAAIEDATVGDGYAILVESPGGGILPAPVTGLPSDPSLGVPAQAGASGKEYIFKASAQQNPAEPVEIDPQAGSVTIVENSEDPIPWGSVESQFALYDLESLLEIDPTNLELALDSVEPLVQCDSIDSESPCTYDPDGTIHVPANSVTEIFGPIVAWAHIKVGSPTADGHQPAGGFLSIVKDILGADKYTHRADHVATPLVLENVGNWFMGSELSLENQTEMELGELVSFKLHFENLVPLAEVTLQDDTGTFADLGLNGRLSVADGPELIPPSPPEGYEWYASYSPENANQIGFRTFTVEATDLTGELVYTETFEGLEFEVKAPQLDLQVTSIPESVFFGEPFEIEFFVADTDVLDGTPLTVNITDELGAEVFKRTDTTVRTAAATKFTATIPGYSAADLGESGATELQLTINATAPPFLNATPVLVTIDLLPGDPIITVDDFGVGPDTDGFEISFDLLVASASGIEGTVDVDVTLDYLGDSPFDPSPDSANDLLACQSSSVSTLALGTVHPMTMQPCSDGAELKGWYALHFATSNGGGNILDGSKTVYTRVVYDDDSTTGEVTVEDAASMLLDFALDATEYALGETLTATAIIRDGNGLANFGELVLDVLLDGDVVATYTCDDVVQLATGCDGFSLVGTLNEAGTEATLEAAIDLPLVLDDDVPLALRATIAGVPGSKPPVYADQQSVATINTLSFTTPNVAPTLLDTELNHTLISPARAVEVSVNLTLEDGNWGSKWGDVPVATLELATLNVSVVSGASGIGVPQSFGLTYNGALPVSGTDELSVDLSTLQSDAGNATLEGVFAFIVPEAMAAGAYRVLLNATDDDGESVEMALPFDVLPLPKVDVGALTDLAPGADLVVDLTVTTSDASDLEPGMFSEVLVRVSQTDSGTSSTAALTSSKFDNFVDAGPITIADGIGAVQFLLTLPAYLDDEFTYAVEAIVVPVGLADANDLAGVLAGCDPGLGLDSCSNTDVGAFSVTNAAPSLELDSVELDGTPWLGHPDVVYVLPGVGGSSVAFALDVDDANWGSSTGLDSTEIASFAIDASGLTASLDDSLFGTRSTGEVSARILTVLLPAETVVDSYPVRVTVIDDNGATTILDLPTIRVSPWFELSLEDDTNGFPGLQFTGVGGGGVAPGDTATTALDPLRVTLTGSLGAGLIVLQLTDFVNETTGAVIPASSISAKLIPSGTTDPLATQQLVSTTNGMAQTTFSATELTLDVLVEGNSYVDIVLEFTVPDGTPTGTYKNNVVAEALQAS